MCHKEIACEEKLISMSNCWHGQINFWIKVSVWNGHYSHLTYLYISVIFHLLPLCVSIWNVKIGTPTGCTLHVRFAVGAMVKYIIVVVFCMQWWSWNMYNVKHSLITSIPVFRPSGKQTFEYFQVSICPSEDSISQMKSYNGYVQFANDVGISTSVKLPEHQSKLSAKIYLQRSICWRWEEVGPIVFISKLFRDNTALDWGIR